MTPILSDETLAKARARHRGWDIYALKAEFDAWLAANPDRTPRDYQSAFLGFAQRFCARQVLGVITKEHVADSVADNVASYRND